MGGGEERQQVIAEREARTTGAKSSTLFIRSRSDGCDQGDQTSANRSPRWETGGLS